MVAVCNSGAFRVVDGCNMCGDLPDGFPSFYGTPKFPSVNPSVESWQSYKSVSDVMAAITWCTNRGIGGDCGNQLQFACNSGSNGVVTAFGDGRRVLARARARAPALACDRVRTRGPAPRP